MSQLLAFDFGLARIGVAVGQTITKTASPLDTLKAKQGKPDWQQLTELLAQWKPEQIIVGEPLNMDGTTQKITEKAREFADQLQQKYQVKTTLFDERLSSVAAREAVFEMGGYKKLKQSQIDSIAAVLILESWFNQQG